MFHRLHKIALVALLVATVSASLINEQQETLLLRAKPRPGTLASRNDASLVRPTQTLGKGSKANKQKKKLAPRNPSPLEQERKKKKKERRKKDNKKGGGKSKDKNQDSGVVVNEGDVVVDAVAEEVKPKAKAKVSCKKSCEKIKSLTGNFQCTKSCKKHLQQKAASAKVGQLATDPKIIKAAADAGKTPLEYAKSVVHLTPGEQAKVAQLAANHAKTQEQKKKNEAAAINGYKNFAEEMMKKINMSKEKAVMEAAINYLPTSRANCEKNRCIKEGTGVITDEEALFSGDGAPLGIKKVIYVECVVCPKTEDIYGCVDNSTNYSEYVAYLKCKEKAGHKFFKN